MADHIFYNGIIHTMNGQIVSALAVKNEIIQAIGTLEDLKPLAENTCEFTDLLGNCVVPGFNDTHCHMLLTGKSYDELDLRGVRSFEEIIQRGQAYIKERQLPPGTWVVGGNFDQNIFDPPILPDKHVLDAISTVHPILLDRVCGHVATANSLAMSLSGYDGTENIPGGAVDKDANGEPTGILWEAALDRFKLLIPKATVETVKHALTTTMEKASAAGLTSMQSNDTGSIPVELIMEACKELEAEGHMSIRIFEEVSAPTLPLLEKFLELGLRTGDGNDFFKIGNIKLFADGSLGARSASLRKDYCDDPGNRGIAVYSQEELDELVLRAHQAGMQVAVHAIGDGAVAQCVQAFQKAWEYDHKDLRNRIVHCQFVDEELLNTMASNHIAADIQPPFVPSDSPLTSSRLGVRENGGYVWKSMINKGIRVGGGSDSPVETFDPIWGIHCAVNRTDENLLPKGGWHPDEKLSVEEAVKLYTSDGAYLSFEEHKKGTLEAGKLADFVVLDQNLFEIPADHIKDTKVLMTVLGGKIVFRKN